MSIKSKLNFLNNNVRPVDYKTAAKSQLDKDLDTAFSKIMEGAMALQNIALGCVQRDNAAELGAVIMGIAADVMSVASDVAAIESEITSGTWGVPIRSLTARNFHSMGLKRLPFAAREKIRLEKQHAAQQKRIDQINKRLR